MSISSMAMLSNSTTSTSSATSASAASPMGLPRPGSLALLGDFSSANIMRSRSLSVTSSYLSDDDLFLSEEDDGEAFVHVPVEVAASSSPSGSGWLSGGGVAGESSLPSYHVEDERARRAVQELRRMEAMRGMKGKKKRSGAELGRKKKSRKAAR